MVGSAGDALVGAASNHPAYVVTHVSLSQALFCFRVAAESDTVDGSRPEFDQALAMVGARYWIL